MIVNGAGLISHVPIAFALTDLLPTAVAGGAAPAPNFPDLSAGEIRKTPWLKK
jgi:hypothetical protein